MTVVPPDATAPRRRRPRPPPRAVRVLRPLHLGQHRRAQGHRGAHRGVVDLCEWQHRRFAFTPADRSAVVCSQSFDGSVLEIWPALTAGASLAIADEGPAWTRSRWPAGTPRPASPSRSCRPPSAKRVVAWPRRPAAAAVPRARRRRAAHPAAARRAVRARSTSTGPTEVTVLCTRDRAPARRGNRRRIALGRPVDNVRLRVLDGPAARCRRHDGRAVRRRTRRRPGLPAPPRADGASASLPIRSAAGRPPLPHRRPGPLDRRAATWSSAAGRTTR